MKEEGRAGRGHSGRGEHGVKEGVKEELFREGWEKRNEGGVR